MNARKMLKVGLAVLGIVALVATLLGGLDCLAAVSAGGGMTLAFAGVVANPGTPVEGTLSSEKVENANEHIFDEDVIKKIVQVRPSVTPLDTILRSLSGKGKSTSWKTRFFSNGVRAMVTTLKAAVPATSGSSLNKVHQITLSNEAFADTDDVLMFQDVTGSDNMPLVCHVVSRDINGVYTVMMSNGTGTNERDTPALPENTLVTRLSTAKNELDARGDDYAQIPEDDYNYQQIIMSTLSQGLYEQMLKKKVDFSLSDLKDITVYDFRRKCEGALMFGHRSKLMHPTNGRAYYHMGGIIRKVAKNKMTFASTAKVSDTLVDWAKHIFVGNNGADTRYAFAGDDIIAWMSKRLMDDTHKIIDANKTEVVAGIRFNKIETEFGTLMLRHHPDFGTYGMQKKMVVFDPDYIELRSMKPMGIREIDNAKNGTELSKSYVFEEVFTNVVTNPSVHSLIEMTA